MSATSPFAQWLKQRRRELDLTQEELAERLNCSVVTISKIEMGQRRPSKQIAELLATELCVPVDARGDFLHFARGLIDTFSDASSIPSTQSTSAPLPTPSTLLLGREHELAHIAHVLNDSGGRLLTLTGPGGVGKTRLALQAAHLLQAARDDGALFVSLAGVVRSADVPSAIATALGLTLHGDADLAQQLIAHLRPRRCLLVLDNLEQVLAGGETARLLTRMLTETPALQLIATSREPTGVPGEWAFRVQGLPVPAGADAGADAGAGSGAGSGAEAGSAMQLFVQAAQRADAQFAPDGEALGAIVRICRAVEGVPLAIELAAAWVSTLSPREVAAEIVRSLDFLATSSIAVDPRQRSMRVVFEQSWRLLSVDEQRALAALSAFRGGFTREAAADAMTIPLLQLAALLSKSLIRRNAEDRYDLHELVRQFAAEKLAEDAAAERAAHEAHAHFFLSVLREAEPKLRSAGQDAMLARLVSDVDNLRVAWDRAIAFGWLDEINGAMRGLARLYSIKSWNEEGVQRLGAAAALRDDASTAHVRTYQAWFLTCLDDDEGALRLLDTVFERLEGVTDTLSLIEPNLFRGLILLKTKRYDDGQLVMQRVQHLARQVNNRWYEGIAVYALAYSAFLRDGETEHSFAGMVQASEMLRGEGDVFQAVSLLQDACLIAISAGRLDEAERLLAECTDVTERLGSQYTLGITELQWGRLALARGEGDEARQHFQRSHTLFLVSRASKQAAEALALLRSIPSANT